MPRRTTVLRRRAWLALLLLGRVAVAHAGVVEGRVPVASPAPALALDFRYDLDITGKVATPDPPASAVSLEPEAPGARHAEVPAPPRVEQRDFQFNPGLLVVPVGTTVTFPNRDDTYHSVFSYSDTKRFDLGRYLKDDRPPVIVFERPGLVRLFCEIHEHMRGYVLVVDTPWFTKTDGDGRFRIADVPPGRYRMQVWVDPRRALERPIEVRADEATRVDLTGAGP